MAKKAKKKPKPFDPLAPSFKYQKGFNRAVKKRARAQVAPALQDVKQRRTEAVGAHETRQGDLKNWYDYALGARQAGQSQLGDSLKAMLGSLQGMGGDAQAGLSAALRQSADAQAQESQRLGAAVPTLSPEYADTLAAYGQGGQMGLTGDIAGILQRGAAETGITGIAGRVAGEQEDARFKSVMDALTKERTDIRSRIPDLREQARAAIIQEEMGKAGQAFQQDLATQQFGETKRTNRFNERQTRRQTALARDQFGETQKTGRAQRKEARERLKLDKQTLQLEKDKLTQAQTDATDEATQKRLEQRGKRFDKAAQWLEGYLAPTDRDNAAVDPSDPESKSVFNQGQYDKNHTFDEAYHAIQRKFGLGPLTTLSILGSVPNPRWRERADKMKGIVKLNRTRKKQGVKGPPTPTGLKP